MGPGRPTIALIGMRAVGKTTVGRALAERLERTFLDLDDETLRFARHAGHEAESIGALLSKVGRTTFRELEAYAVRRVFEPCLRCVCATGGGVVERADNRAWLARSATVVWLDAKPETIEARIAADGGARPGLTGDDPVREVRSLLRKRAPLYEGLADLRFEADGSDAAAVQSLADEIARALAP